MPPEKMNCPSENLCLRHDIQVGGNQISNSINTISRCNLNARIEVSTIPRVKLAFIEPMYAHAVTELPSGDPGSYEASLDGYRCLAAEYSGVTLWSRRDNGFTNAVPRWRQCLRKAAAKHANRWGSGCNR